MFAKYILRRTDAELAALEGETVSEWETKVGEAAEDEAEDDDVPDITAMIRSLGRSYRSR